MPLLRGEGPCSPTHACQSLWGCGGTFPGIFSDGWPTIPVFSQLSSPWDSGCVSIRVRVSEVLHGSGSVDQSPRFYVGLWSCWGESRHVRVGALLPDWVFLWTWQLHSLRFCGKHLSAMGWSGLLAAGGYLGLGLSA